jgi:peptidoglycan-associated lipoprotein
VRDETGGFTIPDAKQAGVLRPIYFEFDQYQILSSARPTLHEIADCLHENPSWKVLIEGHCDERGSDEYNLALGEQRAQSTRRYLMALGIKSQRFQTISYGEERPAKLGHHEDSWAENRRAEFRVRARGM